MAKPKGGSVPIQEIVIDSKISGPVSHDFFYSFLFFLCCCGWSTGLLNVLLFCQLSHECRKHLLENAQEVNKIAYYKIKNIYKNLKRNIDGLH